MNTSYDNYFEKYFVELKQIGFDLERGRKERNWRNVINIYKIPPNNKNLSNNKRYLSDPNSKWLINRCFEFNGANV